MSATTNGGTDFLKMDDGRTLTKEQTLSAVRNKNSEVIKQITTGDFAEGGQLNRQQFATFYEEVLHDADFLDRVRRVPVDGPQARIERIGVGENLLRAVDENERVVDHSVNTGAINIDVTKTGFGWDLTQEVVEDTLEAENTAELILQHFTSQYSFDLETLGFQGDTSEVVGDGTGDPHPFYAILDGWDVEARADGAVVKDYAAANDLDEQVLFDLTLNMPQRYLDTQDMVFIANPSQVVGYRRNISDRATDLGDQAMSGQEVPTPTGYPLVGVQSVPVDTVYFTDPQNLLFAPHRDMTVNVTTESEPVVKRDLFAQYSVLSRIDFAVEQGEAVAIADNLADPAA